MYSHLDLQDIAVPNLPPLRLGRPRSSSRSISGPASKGGRSAEPSHARPPVQSSAPAPTPPRSPRAAGPATDSPRLPSSRPPLEAKSEQLVALKSRTVIPSAPPSSAAPPNSTNLLNTSQSSVPTGRKKSVVGADGTPLSPSTMYIVDKPPKTMRMVVGDHYYLPISVTSLRVEMTYEALDGQPMAELGASLYTTTAKKIGNVSSISKTVRDRSITHLIDEWAPAAPTFKGEAVLVNLATVPVEAAYLLLSISSVTGKQLVDVDRILIRVVDVGFYPGCPELLCFEFNPPQGKSTCALPLVFAKEKSVIRVPQSSSSANVTGGVANVTSSASPAGKSMSAKEKEIQAPTANPLALWTIKSIGISISAQKTPKLLQTEIEEVIKRLASGWLPVAKGIFQSGGDPSRIVGDRMFRKAQKSIAGSSITPSDADLGSIKSGVGSSDEECIRSRRDSVDTMTPIDTAQEEFDQLFQLQPPKAGQGRPRVVRRTRCVYSVGRPCMVPQKQRDRDSDDDVDSDEEELFRQVFAEYASRRVIRYDDHTYNIGTSKDELLQFYLDHRDHFDSAIDGSAAPRAPLVVDCVFNDDSEDVANFGFPPLQLDDIKEASVRRRASGFGSDQGMLGRRYTTDVLGESVFDVNFQPDSATQSLLRGTFVEPNAQDASSPFNGSKRFGPLKPSPPMDMIVLREHQEQLRKEEEEKTQREEAARAKLGASAAPRRSVGSAGLPPPSSTMPTTFKVRGTSAGAARGSVIHRPNTGRRGGSARSHRRRQGPALSGQLMQWIDAYMKREETLHAVRRSPTNASSNASHAVHSVPPPLSVLHLRGVDPVLTSEASPSSQPDGSIATSPMRPPSSAPPRSRRTSGVVIREPVGESSRTSPTSKERSPSPPNV